MGIGFVKSPFVREKFVIIGYSNSPVSGHPPYFSLVSVYGNNSRKRTALWPPRRHSFQQTFVGEERLRDEPKECLRGRLKALPTDPFFQFPRVSAYERVDCNGFSLDSYPKVRAREN